MLIQHKLSSRAEPPRRATSSRRSRPSSPSCGPAEQAFAQTHAELAARSDALAEQEAALAARERAVAEQESPATPELEALEARIRRLEQSGRKHEGEPQTFSAGLRALQERGLRAGRVTGRASTLNPGSGR